MNITAIEPSPTADATLLIEPCRTSPATNTPGKLVIYEKLNLIQEDRNY